MNLQTLDSTGVGTLEGRVECRIGTVVKVNLQHVRPITTIDFPYLTYVTIRKKDQNFKSFT